MNSLKWTQKIGLALLLGLALVLLSLNLALAASGIDPINKWAWSANSGWINFAPDNGGVTVYSDHLEGYAWGENLGWIRLGTCIGGSSCTYANTTATNYGVNNDGSGNLSGYAWGANIGWINFKPDYGGVTIDPAIGQFDGYAWGENVGWIHFKNASPAYKVNTAWRAASSNANLSSLVLSSGALTPPFATGTITYTQSVANSVTSLTVTPTVADATATVTVNGTTVASGSASGAIALNVGVNTISIVVTAQDGITTKTYTVTVTRAAGGGGGGGLVLPPPTIVASDGLYLDKVNVTWSAVSGAGYYLAYRSTSPEGVKVPVQGYYTANPGGADLWAAPGVTYYYWVRACNEGGCSDFSASDTGWQGLPAPVISASDGTFLDKVQVSLSPISGATSYLGYRSLSPDGTKIPLNGYFTTFPGGDDIWATPGVTYYYWVKACNGSNCSALGAFDTGWR